MRDMEHEPSSEKKSNEITDPRLRQQQKPASSPDTSTSLKPFAHMRGTAYLIVGLIVVLIFAYIIARLASPVNQKVPNQPLQPTPTPIPNLSSAGSSYEAVLTVAGGVAYIGTSDGNVYALHPGSSHPLWHHNVGKSVYFKPVVTHGIIYISANQDQGTGTIYALRAADGSVLWSYTATANIDIPVVANGVVYITTESGMVSARQASNGTELWHYTATDIGDSTSLSLVDNILYVTSSGISGAVYALQAGNGNLLWHYKVHGYTDTPVIADGIAYIAGEDQTGEGQAGEPIGKGVIAAIRISDGRQLWSREIADTTTIQSPIVESGNIYFITEKIILETPTPTTANISSATSVGSLLNSVINSVPSGAAVPHKSARSSIYALRAGNGTELWHYAINGGKEGWASWLVIDHGVLYTSSYFGGNVRNPGHIYALQSSNGAILWQRDFGDSLNYALLNNGILYGASGDGVIYAWRTQDGSQIWSYPTTGQIMDVPILAGNTLYVTTIAGVDGVVFALSSNNGARRWQYHITTTA